MLLINIDFFKDSNAQYYAAARGFADFNAVWHGKNRSNSKVYGANRSSIDPQGPELLPLKLGDLNAKLSHFFLLCTQNSQAPFSTLDKPSFLKVGQQRSTAHYLVCAKFHCNRALQRLVTGRRPLSVLIFLRFRTLFLLTFSQFAKQLSRAHFSTYIHSKRKKILFRMK